MKSAPNFSVFAAFENEGVNRVGGLQHIDVEEGMAGQSGNLEVMTDQRFFRILPAGLVSASGADHLC